jgi:hypothetical protein
MFSTQQDTDQQILISYFSETYRIFVSVVAVNSGAKY